MTWEAERRLDYIDYRMVTARCIRRCDIVRTFGVSTPQASMDINAFIRLYPGSLVYDKSAKMYVPADGYKTVRGNTPAVVEAMKSLWNAGAPMAWG